MNKEEQIKEFAQRYRKGEFRSVAKQLRWLSKALDTAEQRGREEERKRLKTKVKRRLRRLYAMDIPKKGKITSSRIDIKAVTLFEKDIEKIFSKTKKEDK